MKYNKQLGFAHLEIILVVVGIIITAAVGYMFITALNNKSNEDVSSSNAVEAAAKSEVRIKNIGINLDYYDPQTNKAGDFEFTQYKFAEGSVDSIFLEYGRREPNNSVEGISDRYNPQPTFLAPLGTKIRALIDGTVVNVPKLYSNDYSVHMQGEGSDYIFETEHVINVKVKKGDKVKAGQVIAEISDYNGDKLGGLGLFEIGVLVPGNPPKHVCTFDYLDDSIRDETLKKITALQKSWEEYRGDPTIHDESKAVIPGCLTREPIEG